MKALIERSTIVSRSNGDLFKRKVGAAVIAVRRAGATHVLSSINYFFPDQPDDHPRFQLLEYGNWAKSWGSEKRCGRCSDDENLGAEHGLAPQENSQLGISKWGPLLRGSLNSSIRNFSISLEMVVVAIAQRDIDLKPFTPSP